MINRVAIGPTWLPDEAGYFAFRVDGGAYDGTVVKVRASTTTHDADLDGQPDYTFIHRIAEVVDPETGETIIINDNPIKRRLPVVSVLMNNLQAYEDEDGLTWDTTMQLNSKFTAAVGDAVDEILVALSSVEAQAGLPRGAI